MIVAFVLVSLVFFIGVLAVGVTIGRWPFVDTYLAGDPPFGDLGVLLNMSSFFAGNPGGNPYSGDWGNESPIPNYPSLLPRALAMAGITADHQVAVGVTLGVLVGLTLIMIWAAVLRKSKNQHLLSMAFFAILTIFSPPVMLLIERGNYDSLILILVGLLVTIKNPLLATLVISTATLSKIFPLAAVVGFVRSKKTLMLAVVPVGLLALYIVLAPQDFASVDTRTPRPSWNGYGLLVFKTYFEEFFPDFGSIFSVLFTLFVHLIAIAVYIWLSKRQVDDLDVLSKVITVSPFLQRMLLMGFPVFLMTYLFGNSFDYRLVFLLIPLISLVGAGLLSTPSGVGWSLTALMVLYWSIPGFQISPLGDFVLILLICRIFHVWIHVYSSWIESGNPFQNFRFGLKHQAQLKTPRTKD